MTDETTLPLCPFCKSVPTIDSRFIGKELFSIGCSNKKCIAHIRIITDNSVTPLFDSLEEAIDAWNRRYTEDDLK